MTVTYTAEVATCRGFGCFIKLLLRWRASVYKLVWFDLAAFLILNYAITGIHRFLLDDVQKGHFKAVVEYCKAYSDKIPLSFVLGFYVSIVMTRWWNQYMIIPWPDSIAVFVSATIHGQDERGRLMRRTIVRYVCVCLTLVLTNISPRVKKRFPTLEHFVDAGLLLENELSIFQSLNAKFPKPGKHWLPIVWASSIVTRARKEGRVRDDFAVKTLIDELNKFRGNAGRLIHYDMISVPLVYTQVVTLAVYSYFLTCIMGRQWTGDLSAEAIDLYFPFFTTLEFLFYMGWLKVAETLINPFGEDDDDFEVNWIIDRNLQVSYLIVDEMHHEHPELIRDQYWDEVFPMELPYTAAAQPFREEHPESSTAGIQLSAAQQELQPSSVRIEDLAPEYNTKFHNDLADDAASGIHFTAGGKMSRSGSRVSTRERRFSGGSTPSNIGGSLTRVNSVTNVLRRLFSREDRPDGNKVNDDTRTPGKIPNSNSTASLQQSRFAGGGSMRIGVIEEVDEQMTMTSMRPETRPHVQSIFPQGAPPPSAPMNVPGTVSPMNGRNGGEILSTSAPAAAIRLPSAPRTQRSTQSARSSAAFESAPGFEMGPVIDIDNISMSSTSTMNSDDEFLKLKTEREKQRREKAVLKLARSISAQTQINHGGNLNASDSEALLTELTQSSRISIRPRNDNNTDHV
ncbi:bestrophin-4 isoform X1 [Neodiprion pinetum]|uniref:Bestrophin homolog n=2 Tax=Neodiprion lecontei TaxID=441921 RepID=A0A6J0BJV9_NEOLC|nr:bestrophin-4 isoform X1 [Neodiprion lecontei]XP_046423527.1 bestrophin-4 isoform X1 [Neodiprion fabricii]XP_046479917.1 bestrophin-4 isoform X1 [Neodiprion pinetum]XP_046617095.1 bestrophin-4 isoform X1 [Neodiprion virginianus]